MASTLIATPGNERSCRFRLRSLASDTRPARYAPEVIGRPDSLRDRQIARWFVSLCGQVLSGRCSPQVLEPHIAPDAAGQWRRLHRWAAPNAARQVSLRPSRVSRVGADRIELVAMLTTEGRQRVVSLTLGRVGGGWRLTGCRLI